METAPQSCNHSQEELTSQRWPPVLHIPLTAILAVCCAFVLLAGAGWLIHKEWHAGLQALPLQRTLTRLTFDDGLQIGATWSPDGRFIAYSSDRGGKFDIWVQQVSGGDPIQITKRPGQNWQPDWSPDGKYIAYRSEEGDGGIYVIPALGGAGLERKIAPFGYYPQWSPDSSQVLFRTHFTAIGYSNRFYVAQLDGSPPREVWPSGFRKSNCGRLQPPGIRMERGSPSGSDPPRPAPVFWTIPIAGGPAIKLEIAPAVQKELAQASGDSKAGQQFGEYSFSWSPSGDAIYFERGYRRRKKHLEADSRSRNAASHGHRSPDHRPGTRCRTRGFSRWQAAGLHGEVAADSDLAVPV